MRLLRALPKQALQVLKDAEPTTSEQPLQSSKPTLVMKNCLLWNEPDADCLWHCPFPVCCAGLERSDPFFTLKEPADSSWTCSSLCWTPPQSSHTGSEWVDGCLFMLAAFADAAQRAVCCWYRQGGSLTAQTAPSLVWIYKVLFHKVCIWKVEY